MAHHGLILCQRGAMVFMDISGIQLDSQLNDQFHHAREEIQNVYRGLGNRIKLAEHDQAKESAT